MVWRRLDYGLINDWISEGIDAHPMNYEAAARYVMRRILMRGDSELAPMLLRLARQQIRDRVSSTLEARYRAAVGRRPKPKPKLVPKPPPAGPRKRAIDLGPPPPRRRTRPTKK